MDINIPDPLLCEVPYESSSVCGPQCRVAAAAEQDGLCGRGEQLLLTPFGEGACGCRVEPPHRRYRDGARCFQVTKNK